MICPRCGANNDNSEQFCYNCGLRLDSAAQGQPQAGPSVPQPPSPPPVYNPQPGYGDQSYGSQPPVYPNPGNYQPSYGGQQQYAPVQPNSTAAIVSLIAGIVSWIAFPFVSAIVAVIAGHMARAEIRRSGGRVGGGGMALAGLILGYLNILLVVAAICFFIFIFIAAATSGQ